MTARGFIIWPNDKVEEVVDDELTELWTAPGLFDRLVLGGYPLHKDPDGGRWDGVIDVSVDEDTWVVTAFTQGPPPREHSMGNASRLFIDWMVEAT